MDLTNFFAPFATGLGAGYVIAFVSIKISPTAGDWLKVFMAIWQAKAMHKATKKRFYVIRTQSGIQVLQRSEISNKGQANIKERLEHAIYVTP
jgi:hypothetical protein